MKFLIVFVALFAVALAAPAESDAETLKFTNDNIGAKGYNFAYETSNGISQQEYGQIQDLGTEDEAISVKGQYAYVGDDGQTFSVNYIADRNGFQPQGAHLPVAP